MHEDNFKIWKNNLSCNRRKIVKNRIGAKKETDTGI